MANMPSNFNPPRQAPNSPRDAGNSDTQRNAWGKGNSSNGHENGGPQGNGGFSRWGAGFPVEGDWEDSDRDPKHDRMEEWEEWKEEQDDAVTDYYALLNVPRDVLISPLLAVIATTSQIRSSYHNLSLRFHPDKQPPDQRERTTAHFNNILVAYETLMNPHKRAIYDALGVEGLKQKAFDVGIKAMDPEEFKVWLQEQIRKHKVAEVMSLVNSRGDITIALDVSGLQFQEAKEVIGPDGRKRFQLKNMPPVRLTKYVARHSFTVPLERLGNILTTPFPTFKDSASKGEAQNMSKAQPQAIPIFTLTAFLGGIPVQTKNKQQTHFATPGLSAQITHSFPPVHPEAPLSIASVLSGLDIEATSTIFPQRVFSASVSKSFGSSRLIFKPIFNYSPALVPPTVEATYATTIGKRGNFFIQYNSGAASQWPSAIAQLLAGPPLTSHLTIGYTMMPIIGTPIIDDDDDASENETPQYLRPKKQGRSKATETWRVTATAGFLVGGGQMGLSWGRTYFIGTPIGRSSTDPIVKARGKPKGEGIRVNVDATLGLLGGMVINLRASRNIFTNTRMGVGVGIGGVSGDGVVFSINWSRLGQKITLPIVIAPILERTSILYGTLVPFVGYALLETLYLRPTQRRLKKKEMEKMKRQLIVKVSKNKKKAEEIVELMKSSVEASQQKKRETGGLVIIEAGYGVKRGAQEWADVTVALVALMDDDQVVIPRGVNKNHITGFYDPAPGEKKELWVKYLFKGRMHEITVKNNRGLVIPMRAHCIE